MWKVILTVVLAAVATLASTAIPAKVLARYPEIMGCEHACAVSAAGWPRPYLVDYPGISPPGSVSLFEGLVGTDIIWGGALATTFAFWFVLIGACMWALGRARRLG